MTDDTTAATDQANRNSLLQQHAAARGRRDRAPLGSSEHGQAVIEVGELEVQINSLDVATSEGRLVPPARHGGHHS